MERIGVGIITYYAPEEAQRGIESVLAHAQPGTLVKVHDNSENDEVAEWVRHHCPVVEYVRSPYNAGCWAARNRLAERFIRDGIGHFVIQDEDVEWAGDAAAPMRAVFARHPDTGVVGWGLAIKQMGGDKPDETGAVRQLPGMCNMYSAACVKAARGWEASVLMYRMDTLFCLIAGKRGFKTRIVRDGECLVRHNHPHQGVQRFPWWKEEQRRSQRVFTEILAREGIHWP